MNPPPKRSIPERLADWSGNEPRYDHLYVVRIIDCNPKRMSIRVKRLKPKSAQASLKQEDLDFAQQNGSVWAKPTQGGKLNFVLSSARGRGALVVFHLVDAWATFIDNGSTSDTSMSVMRGRDQVGDILFRPKWVGGSKGNRKAVSVIMAGGAGVQEYGLGIYVKDKNTGAITPIIVDPKIENDGDDR
jgi:hypothetical protein